MRLKWNDQRIAAIQHRLADALEGVEPGNGWRAWRAADGHPHRIEAVRAHLADAGKAWQDLSEEQRQEYVLSLFAPLPPSQELLAELVATATPVTATALDGPTLQRTSRALPPAVDDSLAPSRHSRPRA
ncbi:hypothetical protein ACTWLT_19505 [Micromonospora sp. ZYX-F-536]|uniref:hypothetical protein n=1 Tax=Micromonospora sp. ZYX-F-536 TaxID=3457629 RepID=UPI0040408B95